MPIGVSEGFEDALSVRACEEGVVASVAAIGQNVFPERPKVVAVGTQFGSIRLPALRYSNAFSIHQLFKENMYDTSDTCALANLCLKRRSLKSKLGLLSICQAFDSISLAANTIKARQRRASTKT